MIRGITAMPSNAGESAVCVKCGKTLKKSEIKHRYDDRPLCEDCLRKYFTSCIKCSEIIYKDKAVYHEDAPYCIKCGDAFFTICTTCGNEIRIAKDDVHFYKKKPYCESCAEKDFVWCDDCGEMLSRYGDTIIYARGGYHYCESCAPSNTVTCNICDTIVRKRDAAEFNGFWCCYECYANLPRCSFCNQRLLPDEAYNYGQEGDRKVCRSCIDEKHLLQCSACKDFFSEDFMARYNICIFCDEKEIETESKKSITDAEVATEYPGLKKRISEVFDRSARNRWINARDALDVLRKMLPEITIDESTLTYINEIGKSKPLNDLLSPKNSLIKQKRKDRNGDEFISRLSRAIDRLNNMKSDIAQLLKTDQAKAFEKIIDALKLRIYNERRIENLKEATDNLVGEYAFAYAPLPRLKFSNVNLQGCGECMHLDEKTLGDECVYAIRKYQRTIRVGRWQDALTQCEYYRHTGHIATVKKSTVHRDKINYTFLITKDPVAIMAKTTSQCWENMSCEKIVRGSYGQGAFADIGWLNLVCFVLDEKKLPIARIMIRWCKTEHGTIDFGIEKKWYYCVKHPDNAREFAEMGDSTPTKTGNVNFLGGLSANHAIKFLVSILLEKGKIQGL